MINRRLGLPVSLLALAVSSFGQSAPPEKKNQLGFLFGGEFIPSNSLASPIAVGAGKPVSYTGSLTLQLNYGRQLHDFKHVALWLDVPALVGPNHRITNGNPFLPTSNATFYVTPSARLLLPSKGPLTPWLSSGFGYGLFETSDYFEGGTNNPTIHTHTGVAQFGGGVDIATHLRILFPLTLRAEVRDFYALSQPTYPVPVTGNSQHNVTINGGATIHF